MGVPVTLVTLHDEMQLFCNEHKGIERFEFEYEEQLPNLSTDGKSFPFVFAVPIDMVPSGSLNQHTIRIYVYNRIDRDRTNILDSTNDTSLIISDLIKWWGTSNRYSNIELVNEPLARALNNSQLDYLQGYVADFVFSVPTYSRCDIPVPEGIPTVIGGSSFIDPYLTCLTLSGCSTFSDLSDDVTTNTNNIAALSAATDNNDFTTGATLSSQTISFDRTDTLSAYSVDLSPALGNYLPLSGGTLTGDVDLTSGLLTINNFGFDGSYISFKDSNNLFEQGGLYNDINDNLILYTNFNNIELSPAESLQINGDTFISGNLEVLGSATTINTEIIQAKDNNIELNYQGTHLSAEGGGLTIIDGVSLGKNSEWLINGDGDWYTNQSVGIGIDTPIEKLHVDGALRTELGIESRGGIIESNVANGELRSYQFQDSFYVSLKTDTGAKKSGIFRSNADFFVYYDTSTGDAVLDSNFAGSSAMIDGNAFIKFNIDGVEKARFDTTGNLGIGTSTPTSKLSVSGTADINGFFIVDDNSPYALKGSNTNTLYGFESMLNSSGTGTSTNNTAIGYRTLRDTEGGSNVGLGYQVLTNNTTGARNVGIGINAAFDNTTGDDNVAIGALALRFNTTGSQNFALGRTAMYDNVTGSRNIAIGNYAARFGNNNNSIFIGDNAGLLSSGGTAIVSSTDSMFIGNNAYSLTTTPLNEIVIGDGAIGNGDNTTTIGNNSTTDTHLRGELHVDVERWTIDLTTSLSTTIYASESLSITLVEDIVNAPTTQLFVNGAAYTLSDPIVSGDKIDILVDTASVIKLKIEK